jgi:hypothetical protein
MISEPLRIIMIAKRHWILCFGDYSAQKATYQMSGECANLGVFVEEMLFEDAMIMRSGMVVACNPFPFVVGSFLDIWDVGDTNLGFFSGGL